MVEQSHEFSAKSVEAAIEEGLRQLGTGRDQVDVEVLHEGSRGLLGIGSTNARVRLSLRPVPKQTEKPVAPAPMSTPPVTAAPTAKKQEVEQPAPSASVQNDSTDDDAAHEGDSDVNRDEVIALAGEMLQKMITLMGLDARVESSEREDPDEKETAIYLNLLGNNLDVLISRHGEALSNIQYLLRLMVNQKTHSWTNIVVDVDGYKDRRADKLAQMALRMAAQVVETGRSVALEPMPANERRIIHMALRNHPQVYTESIGEDTRRKIQILLK